MTGEIAVRTHTELSIQPEQDFWTEKQKAALHQLGMKDASNADLAIFFHHAKRTGLDPFAKQIYMIGRWTKDGTKQTIQTGIDGFRLIARRAADRAHERLSYDKPQWCGEDGEWRNVWLAKQPPRAAMVTVYRDGEPFPAVVMWDEFVQTVKDKQTGEQKPNDMWMRMPANQLRKCAEAAALRMAFPQDLSGIYIDDEMPPADYRDGAHVVTAVPSRRVTAAEITGKAEEPKPEPVPSQQETATEEPPAEPGSCPNCGWDAGLCVCDSTPS